MRLIKARKDKVIPIGFQGENGVVTVQFDVTGWSDLYGSGTFSLMNQRPTETTGYPCTVTVANNIVSWVVSDFDVYIAGNGRVQLTYTVSSKIAKSIQFFTIVQKSIGTGTVPEPVPDWLDELQEEIQECQDALQVATNAEIDAALYG